MGLIEKFQLRKKVKKKSEGKTIPVTGREGQ
jgi:hypothetical protein